MADDEVNGVIDDIIRRVTDKQPQGFAKYLDTADALMFATVHYDNSERYYTCEKKTSLGTQKYPCPKLEQVEGLRQHVHQVAFSIQAKRCRGLKSKPEEVQVQAEIETEHGKEPLFADGRTSHEIATAEGPLPSPFPEGERMLVVLNMFLECMRGVYGVTRTLESYIRDFREGKYHEASWSRRNSNIS